LICPPAHKSQELARDCAEAGLFARHGITIGKCLGCGVEGCVYASDPGKVVKITRSKAEVDLSLFLVGDGPSDYTKYLPKIYRVTRITHECAPRTPSNDPANRLAEVAKFLIVREDIPGNLQVDIPKLFDEALLLMQIRAVVIFKQFGTNPDFSRERIAAWDQARREVRGSISEIFGPQVIEFYGDELARVANIIEWGMKHGIEFEDIRIDNLGLRADGTLVMRDLGFSSSSSESREIPAISGLGIIHGRRKRRR
jgi:hypothetical protein